MKAHAVTPILNISDLAESFSWFERLGWRKLWDWGEPPTFGAVGSGNVELFDAKVDKVDAAVDLTSLRLVKKAAKQETRAAGCRSGSKTLTPFTGRQ